MSEALEALVAGVGSPMLIVTAAALGRKAGALRRRVHDHQAPSLTFQEVRAG